MSVCETHSLSRTAALLNYTQSAVSQTIKNFEKELGLEIFIRSKNGMELKSDMTWILESLRAICDAENEIERTAASLVNLDSGLIRIGTIQSISYHWLPGILKDFSTEYPNIRFQLTIGGFGELKEKAPGERAGLHLRIRVFRAGSSVRTTGKRRAHARNTSVPPPFKPSACISF